MITIYLPCIEVPIRVRVAPSTSLAPLEALCLRAILIGMNSLHELVELFGLGERPTLDLVYDLWRSGHVMIDTESGSVYAASGLEEMELADLNCCEIREELQTVIMEQLSGAVLPQRLGRPSRPPANQVVPTGLASVEVGDLKGPRLLAALKRIFNRESGDHGDWERRPRRVLGASLGRSHQNLSQTTSRWLELSISCRHDPERGTLDIDIGDTQPLTAADRRAIVDRLKQVVREKTSSPFVRYVLSKATIELPPPRNCLELLGDLEGKAGGLANVDPGNEEKHQAALEALADDLDAIVADHAASRVTVQAVTSQSAQERAMRDLIAEAERQIVISCPWFEYETLVSYRDDLECAMERGVTVFLIWGFKRKETPRGDVLNALDSMLKRYPHRFFCSRHSCCTHAKFVARDDRRALVSSLNFFKPSKEDELTSEVGVVIAPAYPEAVCLPIEDLLSWAQEIYPDYERARAIYWRRSEFTDLSLVTPDDAPPRPAVPLRQAYGESADAEKLKDCAAGLWAAGWRHCAETIRQRLGHAETTATFVQDGEHRNRLWLALTTAERRLLITSDRLNDDVVTPRFVHALEARLSLGVRVVLIHRRDPRPPVDDRWQPLEQLGELAARFPNLMTVGQTTNHAKVLVADDMVVVGSFNYLSFTGDEDEYDPPSIRRRHRSEVSLVLEGPGVVEHVVGDLRSVLAFDPVAVALDDLLRRKAALPPATPERRDEAASVRESICELLAKLSHVDDEGERARVISDAAREQAEVFTWLTEMRKADLPVGIIMRAAAAALSARCAGELIDDELLWMCWLAEQAWGDERYLEAFALRCACPGVPSARLPRRSIMLIATLRGHADVVEALGVAALNDDLSAADILAIGAAATAELALGGHQDLRRLLEELTQQLPGPWKAVVKAIGAYFDATGLPLPVLRIRAHLEADESRRMLTGAWADLRGAFDRIRQLNIGRGFKPGTLVRATMLERTEPFGRLEAIAAIEAGSELRTWLGEWGGLDLEQSLNEATSAAVGRQAQQITGHRRRRLLDGFCNIIETAKKVAELTDSGDTEPMLLRRLERARRFASVLRDQWDGLEPPSTEPIGEEHAVVLQALRDLRFVREWVER